MTFNLSPPAPCRFKLADPEGHACVRRDGRPIREGVEPCWYETRAQLVADWDSTLAAAERILAGTPGGVA